MSDLPAGRLATDDAAGDRYASVRVGFPGGGALKSILTVSMARGYGTLISIGTLAVSARYLGPVGRGNFAAAVAWATLFATIFHLSLGQALQYRLQTSPTALGISGQLGVLGTLAILLALLAGVAALMLAWIGGGAFGGIDATTMSLAFLTVPLLIWEQFSINILAAAGRMDIQNRAQYIGRTLGILAFLGFVGLLGLGVTGALLAQILTQLAIALLVTLPLWLMANRQFSWHATEVGPLISAGAKAHFTTISAFLLDQASILIINNDLSKPEVAYYQLAQQMIALMLILPQSALLVIYGGLAKSNPDDYWPQQQAIAIKVLVLLFGAACLAYLLAPVLVAALAGPQFLPAVTIFRALLPTLLGMSLAILLTPQWIARGYFHLGNALTAMTAAVVVIATLLVVPVDGLDGAVKVRQFVYCGLIPVVQCLFWAWCSHRSATTSA